MELSSRHYFAIFKAPGSSKGTSLRLKRFGAINAYREWQVDVVTETSIPEMDARGVPLIGCTEPDEKVMVRLTHPTGAFKTHVRSWITSMKTEVRTLRAGMGEK